MRYQLLRKEVRMMKKHFVILVVVLISSLVFANLAFAKKGRDSWSLKFHYKGLDRKWTAWHIPGFDSREDGIDAVSASKSWSKIRGRYRPVFKIPFIRATARITDLKTGATRVADRSRRNASMVSVDTKALPVSGILPHFPNNVQVKSLHQFRRGDGWKKEKFLVTTYETMP